MDAPRAMKSAYRSAPYRTALLRGKRSTSATDMATATAVCDDGHPQKMPFWRNPKWNSRVMSSEEMLVRNSGCMRPVKALYADDMSPAMTPASAKAPALCMRSPLPLTSPKRYKATGTMTGMKNPPMPAPMMRKRREGERVALYLLGEVKG